MSIGTAEQHPSRRHQVQSIKGTDILGNNKFLDNNSNDDGSDSVSETLCFVPV